MKIMHTLYSIFHTIGIRKILFILFLSISIFQFYKSKNKDKRSAYLSDEELEELYEKNEDGLFPWEVDTDDSPERIPKDAKRHIYKKAGPRRGRW